MVDTLLPRGKTRLANLTFHWKRLTSGPVLLTLTNSAGHILWNTKVEAGEELAYPSTAPSLKPGSVYRWSVSLPDAPDTASATFIIAKSEEEHALQEQEMQMESLAFTDETEHRLLGAALLADSEFFGEAIEMLRPLANTKTSPLVYALLRDTWHSLNQSRMEYMVDRILFNAEPTILQQWQ